MAEDRETALADRVIDALALAEPREDSVTRIGRALACLDMSRETTLSVTDVASILRKILASVDTEDMRHSLNLQKTRFRQMVLTQSLTGAQGLDARLTGENAALNRAFASALAVAPRKARLKLFDGAAYLARHPDLAAARVDPLEHFIAGGAAEGRRPGLHSGADLAAVPETIAALLAASYPVFPDMLPVALRGLALDQAGRQGAAVSVVMPTWNRAQTICDAIDSALLQSVQPAEVIVADDGSTDATLPMLRATYPDRIESGQLRLLDLPHAGVSAARNAALAVARGDVIAYLDSDNTWEADHLLYATLGLSQGANSAYTALNRHNLGDGWSDVMFQRFDRAALEHENYIDLNVFVHRRSLTDRLGGFDTALTRLVDWDLILRLTDYDAPQPVAVVTAHHVVDGRRLQNISATEEIGPNMARIRSRLESGS